MAAGDNYALCLHAVDGRAYSWGGDVDGDGGLSPLALGRKFGTRPRRGRAERTWPWPDACRPRHPEGGWMGVLVYYLQLPRPKQVAALAGIPIRHVSTGPSHSLCVGELVGEERRRPLRVGQGTPRPARHLARHGRSPPHVGQRPLCIASPREPRRLHCPRERRGHPLPRCRRGRPAGLAPIRCHIVW